MDFFRRNKILSGLLILVVALNCITLGYLLFQNTNNKYQKKPKPDQEKIAAILTEKLELNDPQVEKLKKIRQDFFDKEEMLRQIIKSQRDSMNEIMFSDKCDTTIVKNIARRVSENEFQMELYRIDQAIQLQKLCTPKQLSRFRNYIKEIRDYFQPQKKN